MADMEPDELMGQAMATARIYADDAFAFMTGRGLNPTAHPQITAAIIAAAASDYAASSASGVCRGRIDDAVAAVERIAAALHAIALQGE